MSTTRKSSTGIISIFGYLVWFAILVRLLYLATTGQSSGFAEALGVHLGVGFALLALLGIPYFIIKLRAKRHGKPMSWFLVMMWTTVIALLLAVGGFYGKSQNKQPPTFVDPGAIVDSGTPSASQSPQESSQRFDPRDALLQMHVDQLSDEQYSSAVDRWLESHPEASSAESRTAMSQLLQEVYKQYPRSALGPALDMALQRGQRNTAEQTAAQRFPAGCIDYTSIEIPARYTGKRFTLNFRNVPLRKFLSIVEQESNRRIISQDDSGGEITACVINVPWDYALDKILADHGYGQTEYNGSIRVFKR